MEKQIRYEVVINTEEIRQEESAAQKDKGVAFVCEQVHVPVRLSQEQGVMKCFQDDSERQAPSRAHSESRWTSEASARQMGHVLLA